MNKIGRPRSEKTRKAILRAAFQLSKKHSFDEITSEQIARKAKVSTATLYRWWDNKESVVLDAYLDTVRELMPYGSRGSALKRLRRYTIRIADFLKSDNGRVFIRLMLAIQDRKDLRKAYYEKVFVPRRAEGYRVVQQAIDAGELPSGVDPEFLINALLGPQILPALLGQAISAAQAETIFDFVVTATRNRD